VFVWRSGIASVSVHPRPRCGNEGSRPQPFTFPAQTVGAIHDGTVAWSCTYPPNLILQNLATGELDEPADWRTFVDAGGGPDSFEVTGLGDDWARIIRSGYHYTDEEGYVNVMTGAVAFLNRPRQYADLNRPHVVRQLCAPLTRSENNGAYGDVPSFQPYASERPYGATVVLGAGTSERETLVLERCGSRRKRVLDRCPQRCSSVQLNGGVLTWLSGTRARAYVLRTSRSYRWSLPIAGDQAGATVIHLRTRMLASIPPHAGGSDWTYWSAFFRPVAVRRGSP